MNTNMPTEERITRLENILKEIFNEILPQTPCPKQEEYYESRQCEGTLQLCCDTYIKIECTVCGYVYSPEGESNAV